MSDTHRAIDAVWRIESARLIAGLERNARERELLRQLRITNADFVGYSMGGGVAMYDAVRHPELVHKLVFAGGASFNSDGATSSTPRRA